MLIFSSKFSIDNGFAGTMASLRVRLAWSKSNLNSKKKKSENDYFNRKRQLFSHYFTTGEYIITFFKNPVCITKNLMSLIEVGNIEYGNIENCNIEFEVPVFDVSHFSHEFEFEIDFFVKNYIFCTSKQYFLCNLKYSCYNKLITLKVRD